MIHESFVQTLPFYSPNDKRMKYQRTWTFDKQALCSLKKKPLNAVLFLTHFSGNHRNRNTVFFPRLLRKIILYFIFFIINKNQNSYETCETLQIDDVMLCPKIRSILWTKYDTFGILPEKMYRLLLLEWFAIDSFEFIGHIYDPSVVSFQCPFWEGHLTFAEQLYKDIYIVNQFAFVTVN